MKALWEKVVREAYMVDCEGVGLCEIRFRRLRDVGVSRVELDRTILPFLLRRLGLGL